MNSSLLILISYPKKLSFIQAVHNGDKLLIEIALDRGKEYPQVFRLSETDTNTCSEIIQSVCVDGELPDLPEWTVVMKDVFINSKWENN